MRDKYKRPLNTFNRPSNHITDTSLHFRDLTDHRSLSGEDQGGEEGGGCISAMDLLTKTDPISGAVCARRWMVSVLLNKLKKKCPSCLLDP